MKRLLLAAGAAAALVMCAGAASATVTIDVTTSYDFSYSGPAATFLGGGTPSPDTSFITFTNTSSSAFTGTVGYTAVSNFGGDQSFSTATTILPGDSVYMAVGPEASNQGGFNGPFGSPQPGVNMFLTGSIGSTAVNFSVLDSLVHSGVARTSPCDGILTDAYVLQGGAPTGCDNGDGFEVSQAQGHYTFSAGNVPEPATWAMLILGMFGLGGALRSRRRTLTA
jgi:hypothetical protein